MDRRTTLKWILAASASMPLLNQPAFAKNGRKAQPASGGYGTDPNLTRVYHPGDCWPLTFTDTQKSLAAALCDVIMPADAVSASASSVGVVEFLDEWVSAPYPQQQKDRPILLEGMLWMDAEAGRRFTKKFSALALPEQHAICDDICYEKTAQEKFAQAAKFFARFRDLTAGGFYSTPIGWKDIGYVGNVPLTKFTGASPELARRLGVSPTLK